MLDRRHRNAMLRCSMSATTEIPSMNLIDTALARVGLRDSEPPWPPARLSLALQGGGSFGAFTWGALERLLEEPAIDLDAVSGSSAGAVNAVLLASGLAEGGSDAAKSKLERFWRRMSVAAAFLPATALAASPLTAGLGLFARVLSPYQLNPFNLNPLREALAAEIDFAALRARSPMRLLIGATRVRDGSLRVFHADELTVDAVLASACLPLIHHTVEIDGEPYWDGGYAANPPLLPLVQASRASHLLIVQVTPTTAERLPTNQRDIARRLEQIHFNATLNAEFEALKYGKILGIAPKLRRLHIGRISAQKEVDGLADASAVNLGWDFLEKLRVSGRRAVEVWLEEAAPREAA
jgi:NTE family protein